MVEFHGLSKKIAGGIPEIGRLPSPALKDDLQELRDEFSLRTFLPDSSQKSIEGIGHDPLRGHDHVKVRASAEVDGGGLVDGGHETVNGLHLKLGVVSQDLIDHRPGPAREMLFFQGDDFRDLLDLFGIVEIKVLEPREDPLLHLLRSIVGKGDGKNISEMVLGNLAGQKELDESFREGVGFSRTGRRLQERKVGKGEGRIFFEDGMGHGFNSGGGLRSEPLDPLEPTEGKPKRF